jgi:predicted ABC-type ATPase
MPSKRTSKKRAGKTRRNSARSGAKRKRSSHTVAKKSPQPTAVAQGLKRPKFCIVAGPNGSGKSVLYSNTDIEDFGRSIWIINPDLLAARVGENELLQDRQANLQAVKRIEKWLKASIRAYQSIGVETVLSTLKYRKLVREAKEKGFEFRLIYVLLDAVETNIARVQDRFRSGGHTVAKDKIVQRRAKSLKQLPWFLGKADHASIYDNSGVKPKLIAEKLGTTIHLDPDAMPEIRAIIQKLKTS